MVPHARGRGGPFGRRRGQRYSNAAFLRSRKSRKSRAVIVPGFRGDGFQRYSNAAFSRPRKFRTFSRLPALAVPGAGVTRLKATVTKATVTRGARAVLRRQQNGIAKRKNARPAPPRATVPAHFRAREQSNSSRRYRMIIFSETRPRKPAYRRH